VSITTSRLRAWFQRSELALSAVQPLIHRVATDRVYTCTPSRHSYISRWKHDGGGSTHHNVLTVPSRRFPGAGGRREMTPMVTENYPHGPGAGLGETNVGWGAGGCQRAKYGHKNSFIFFKSHHSFTSFSLSYALTIDSYDLSYAFPFTHDSRTGKAILLVYGRQDHYWYKRVKNAY